MNRWLLFLCVSAMVASCGQQGPLVLPEQNTIASAPSKDLPGTCGKVLLMLSALSYQAGIQHVDELPLTSIAERFGTPTFVYSRSDFERRYRALSEALSGVPHKLCYAVKANSNLSVLRTFVELGAGFDIVSAGELERVVVAGGDPSSVLFSGVGKRTEKSTMPSSSVSVVSTSKAHRSSTV